MGYDVHRFKEGGDVILGGVKIDYEQGLEAHSDGDVVLHALCDALLGAAALGDIGKHFPDTDPRYKGADSRVLLRAVVQLLQERHLAVVNVDMTIIAQAPKMAPHIPAMRANIAADLGVTVEDVNIKAKTAEKLGFVGRGEGVVAEAVALISHAVTAAGRVGG